MSRAAKRIISVRAGVVVLLLAFASGCAGGDGSPTVATTSEAVANGSSATARIPVRGDGSVSFEAPGLGKLTGGPGSVKGGGALIISAAHGLPDGGPTPPGDFGTGLDVVPVDGAAIVSPLTLSFPARQPRAGLVPVVAHQQHDGTWDLAQAAFDGQNLTFSTTSFSINLPGWLDPAAWADWFKQELLAFFSGRTADPGCKGGAHAWATISSVTSLVHQCLTNNDDGRGERVEVDLTSNRGAYIQVNVPSGADYVWVQDQPDYIRKLIAGLLATDASRTVFLSPGEKDDQWLAPASG